MSTGGRIVKINSIFVLWGALVNRLRDIYIYFREAGEYIVERRDYAADFWGSDPPASFISCDY